MYIHMYVCNLYIQVPLYLSSDGINREAYQVAGHISQLLVTCYMELLVDGSIAVMTAKAPTTRSSC